MSASVTITSYLPDGIGLEEARRVLPEFCGLGDAEDVADSIDEVRLCFSPGVLTAGVENTFHLSPSTYKYISSVG